LTRTPSGEQHQPVEQLVHAVDGVEHVRAHPAQVGVARARVGERDLDLGPRDGQRAAQLMARVGDEALLAGERVGHRAQLAAGQRPPEGGGQQRGAGERDEVLGGQLGERRVGVRRLQRAVQVPAHEQVRRAHQDGDEDREHAAVERGEADADARAHTR
jgi:hypothetical protein